ncbi:TPA: phosphoethanolamine transferase [Pseudomonas putida]|uniref:phosphoethanolamine transferase n=1 Tax=Pseudomonas putida TaxID=303 RepID=UPI002363C7E7|nr:phosphoethanolamine transferase [Pseudomonas putida]MDD2149158.1 phosphoethanolamine transferase [Pseudomonas putida]HDS1681430.1 phosphoethanolamine transferase [Pseudomonas putida]
MSIVSTGGAGAARLLKAEWPSLVLWAFLFSPLFARLLADCQCAKIDLLVLYTFAISFLWLLAIRFASANQFKVHLLLLPFYLLASIDLFLVLNFGSRLTAAYLFIALTNYKEATDFLATYWRSIASILAVFAVCYGVGLAGLHGRRLYRNKAIFALALSGLLLGYGAYFYKTVKVNSLSKGAVLDLVAKDQSTPVGYLSQIGLTATLYVESKGYIKQRLESEVKITSISDQADIQTLVFVIGESSRPHNWSLYGYHNRTTPHLDQQPGLFKFNRMCTTAPYTSVAVPSLLSLEPIRDWDLIASNKSLVGILRAAGYDTYWLSSQEVDSFGGIIPQIAAEAQYRQYLERSYDGALMPALQSVLGKANGRRQAIFIHIKGSHFQYARRYPNDFAQFKPASSSQKDRITADYDNSVLYTDWLLSTIMQQLTASQKKALLVYSSDHGENLLDDSRQLLGHGMGNEYDLSTSAFIWSSGNLSAEQSGKLQKLKAREDQQVSIASLPHTVLNMTGISMPGYDSTQDLLSDDYKPSQCPHLLGTSYVPSFNFDIKHIAAE